MLETARFKCADFFDPQDAAYLDGAFDARNSSEELQALVSELKKARLKMQNEEALAGAWKQRAEAGLPPVNPKRLVSPNEPLVFPKLDPRFDPAAAQSSEGERRTGLIWDSTPGRERFG